MDDHVGIDKYMHFREKMRDGAFCSVQLFLDELDNLLKHLGIQYDSDLVVH